MKKITLLCFLLQTLFSFSQTKEQKIQTYLNANYTKLELTQQDVIDWVMAGETTSESTKITNVFFKQRHAGIEIYNAISNVWMKDNQIINFDNRFIVNAATKINTITPNLNVLDALYNAKHLLNITTPNNHEIIESGANKKFKISHEGFENPISAQLVFQINAEDKLRLAWNFVIETSNHQHLWDVRIDAINGSIIEKNDMVISCNFGPKHNHELVCSTKSNATNFSFFKQNNTILNVQSGSYNVIPYNYESPNHSPRQIIIAPHNTTASPFGWHDTNGVAGNEFTITRGNNVFSQDDTDGNNGTGTAPNGGASLNFDFPYGGTTAQPATYLNAAITNLFYMNNIMHDVWYMYGFNEVNGNFQQNNYGRGGTSSVFGDAVFADAQDGATLEPQNLNNANFSTPTDGNRPRMQMFLWNVAPPLEPLNINSPPDIAGPRAARDNVFFPGNVPIPIAPALIQSDLVLFNDGTIPTSDACTPAINASAINGKIVVIRRGDCTFVSKVKLAQEAGATAVILVNNVAGVINMGGADATITIPAVSVTQEVGEAIITRMQTSAVNVTLQLQGVPFINADGDFDNGIIAHEYGHGISNRLTGGPANTSCLNNGEQMGEGWSDWFTLMMQLKAGDNGASPRGIASFAVSQETTGSGIRRVRYSTDMSINPLTFNDSNDADSQHNRGEFMATVLWDLTWAYIEKYGFDSNIYTGTGGNNKVMRLVIDGLKLQPCQPSFINFRTALIAADQATTGGQDFCMITEVFRRRGVGLNASSGLATNGADQVENFTAFAPGPNCTLNADYFRNEDLFRIYPNPTNGLLNIKINNFVGNVSIQIFDVNGRAVYNKDEDVATEITMNLNFLSKGIYLLKVNGDQLNFTEKFIIN
jgi:extracellular elastinolytic metalloproteinase